MERFEPDFDLIKMNAEIGSYQEDFDPDDRRDAATALPSEPSAPPVDSSS